MKNQQNDIWVGVQDKNNNPDLLESINQEFTELPIIDSLSDEKSLDASSNRRDFLKYLGFGLGAATIAAGCETPIRRAIPYVVKPDEIVPGVATYYASTFVKGGDFLPILVKTREGRPIKIEGNSMSSITRGGTSARAQASVLELYDYNRTRSAGKVVDGAVEKMEWADLDKAAKAALGTARNIRLVTNTVLSPTDRKAINEFLTAYPNAKWVQYDPSSCSAMLLANQQSFGKQVIPDYSFDKASVIVSFDADFLGTWISPVEYARAYAQNRKVSNSNPTMSRHIQVESGMSMTGSNADNRILVKPSQQGTAIATLYNEVAGLTGASKIETTSLGAKADSALAKVAKELVDAKGKSLVISGSNNTAEQCIINKINYLLDNYGSTIGFGAYSMQRQGIDKAGADFLAEVKSGSVDAMILWGANPVYDLPGASEMTEAFSKIGFSVSLNQTVEESTSLCKYVAPAHHLLESWGDAEAKRGHYSLIQPTIHPLFDTRNGGQSILTWAGSSNLDSKADQPYFEYLKANWKANQFANQTAFASFQSFWEDAVFAGVYESPVSSDILPFNDNIREIAGRITKPSNGEMEINFYETVNVGAGTYAHNPWLQEMPDPVTRCVWGNNLSVPVKWNGSSDFDGYKGIGRNTAKGRAEVVEVSINGVGQKVTAITQFGQMDGTVSMAYGYGRTKGGKTGSGIGTNVNNWLTKRDADGNIQYFASDVAISDILGEDDTFACVQYHHTMGITGKKDGEDDTINVDEAALGLGGYQGSLTDRSIIFKTNLKDLNSFKHELDEKRAEYQKLNSHTLYPYEEYKDTIYGQGHHWEMYIDLNACIGCGACTVACMAENNVPVVGKREVGRHHEMSWLRIDRYYYGDAENPNVVYQPMMCQHCDNAPCENVCPVAATNHSGEGLNQMTYNRCIGTRYCANNCPYKVRRFNWLDYTSADLFAQNEVNMNRGIEGTESYNYLTDNITRMVLNPDVTVRSRGVIEKCSFCVQRIQEGKLTAKRESRRLVDSDVKTACQTSCPTGAIVFGDGNNKKGAIAEALKDDLVYKVLEEINTQPSVNYSAKVVNRDESFDA